jgi:hypothetical protein
MLEERLIRGSNLPFLPFLRHAAHASLHNCCDAWLRDITLLRREKFGEFRMLTRLDMSRSARELWIERAKRELSASVQQELDILKDERQERMKDLAARFRIDLPE